MSLCLYQMTGATTPHLGLIDGHRVREVAAAGGPATLADALALPVAELRASLDTVRAEGDDIPLAAVSLVAPVDRQEVWAAGVTYLRSRDARMEESTSAKRAYESALKKDLPQDVRAIVERQYQGVKQNHDRVRDLRNARSR